MAEEVPYGQLSRAEEILEEIKESSLAQEAQLIRQWETTNLQNKLTLDMASKDDIEREYGQQQQGQEVAYSRWSQLYQEKAKDELEELNLEPSKKGGVASEETSDESKTLLHDLTEKTKLSLKHAIKNYADNAKKWIDDKASFSNFAGAVKNDFNLMTGKLQMLTAIPGVTTAIQGLKLVFANFMKLMGFFILSRFPLLFKLLLSAVNAFRKAMGLEKTETLFGKKLEKKEKIKDPGEWKVGGTAVQWKEFQKQKEMFDAQKESQGFWGNIKSGFQKMGKSMGDFFGKMRSNLGALGNTVKDLFSKDGPISKGLSKMYKSFKGWLEEVNESGGMFKYLGGMLKKAGKAVYSAVAFLVGAIWAGIVIAFGAVVTAITAVTLPVWAVIAVLLLIGIGMWMFWEEIKVAWAKVQEAFSSGYKKVQAWAMNIAQSFTELGEDITYYWKYFIAKIKDSFYSMVNGIIDAINFVTGPLHNIAKFDTGNIEELEAGRAEQLELRNPATAQKALDVSVDSKELTMEELVANANARLPSTPVITTVNNNQNVRSHYTGSPRPRDEILRVQNEVR